HISNRGPEVTCLTVDTSHHLTDLKNANQGTRTHASMFLASLSAVSGLTAVSSFCSQAIPRAKSYIHKFFNGRTSKPHSCTLTWDSNEPETVGKTVTFKVRLFHKHGAPFHVTEDGGILVLVAKDNAAMATSLVFDGATPGDLNLVTCKLTVHKAGDYQVSILAAGCHVNGSPVSKYFQPGPIDPSKTGFLNHSSLVVVPACTRYPLVIEPRDAFDNPATYQMSNKDFFKIKVQEAGTSDWHCPTNQIIYNRQERRLLMYLQMDRKGCYRALVTYGNKTLRNGEFQILVLDLAELGRVHRLVTKSRDSRKFPATLLQLDGRTLDKPKKVEVHVSPKQITITENYFQFCAKQLCLFRVCPRTQFMFHGLKCWSDPTKFSVDPARFSIHDGSSTSVQLASSDCSVIAATFSRFLMRRLGGSETFQDKQEFFYRQVRQIPAKETNSRLLLKIDRWQVLKSSYKATKQFKVADWCKPFEVVFSGEEAVDWGGVSREWFDVLCQELFDPNRSQLFVRFTDNPQGLIHPNTKRSAGQKIKLYQFAGQIVGKCLFESAMGRTQLVKARFTRSFLAQLIGVKVTYKHFETDDPVLYSSKISYIENNDVDGLGLTFAEEVYDTRGHLVQIVDLVANGRKIAVTNDNKLQYLDALAQHRLVNQVKDEVKGFRRGLSWQVPKNLLMMFSEHELELLMCGAGTYSVADFKLHHCVLGASASFNKVLSWFWTIVASFTDLQMARLVQFTTGSSQLPPGGFAELTPRIQLSPGPACNSLPSSHTCFNLLYLPDCDNMEIFHRMLLLAITEGSQGFGLV
ncbi:unnamed protein product, partial [Candidula unifasciata]